jgi:hypothetical protein
MAYPAISANEPVARGATIAGNLEPQFTLKAGGAIPPHRMLLIASDGDVEVGTAGSLAIVGCNASEVAYVEGNDVPVGVGKCVLVADDIVSPGDEIKPGDAGRALRFVTSAYTSVTIGTGTAGNFGNQPANDGIEVVSSNAGDTTQSITFYGTTTGTDTVVVETVALNGTTFVPTVKTDWGVLLAATLSASCAGTITIREASADQTITTILTTVLSTTGYTAIAAGSQQAYNLAPTAVAGGASTKVVGLIGTNSAGTTIYDSKALNGTTAVTFATAFKRVTHILLGDVATATVATVKTSAVVDNPALSVGKALAAAAAQNSLFGAFLRP